LQGIPEQDRKIHKGNLRRALANKNNGRLEELWITRAQQRVKAMAHRSAIFLYYKQAEKGQIAVKEEALGGPPRLSRLFSCSRFGAFLRIVWLKPLPFNPPLWIPGLTNDILKARHILEPGQ
jgi:hypothetical protein